MKIKIIILLIPVFFSKLIFCQDSIRVYIIGDLLKNEYLKIHTPDNVYELKGSKSNRTSDAGGLYFYLKLPEDIKDGDFLPILINKRLKKPVNVGLKCYFQSDRKYLVLYRDYRQNKDYPFIERWLKKPLLTTFNGNDYWDGQFNEKYFLKPTGEKTTYSYYFEMKGQN